jgi:ferredoxin--NADP+ reductase
MTMSDIPALISCQDHPIPASLSQETVLSVKHWTDRLFSFRVSRPPSFRFRSGEFVMIGLFNDGKPLLRAYSIASPAWDEELEFYSIKVPDGPLTSRLQHLQPGDKILLGKKPTGTLILDALIPGETLYMFSTGTGIAPFASLIRDPETYEKFEQIVLTQTCRTSAELHYGQALVRDLQDDPLVGGDAKSKLTHFTSLTREKHALMGRITNLIQTGKLFQEIGRNSLDLETDRAMICGSMQMLKDTKALMEGYDLVEGSNSMPGSFVVERAFVG